MGMKEDLENEGALTPVKNYLSEQLLALAELQRPEMPAYDIFEFDPLVDSSSMTPSEWGQIITVLDHNYYDYDGFVVIHGTDTMAYTASAVSFALQNLGKPVIFTGSQLPFGSVYSDARRNVIVAIYCAANFDVPEVCIFFNHKLFRGNRAIKTNSWDLDAFESPNFSPLATLGVTINLANELVRPQPRGRFRTTTAFNTNVVVMRLTPGFTDEVLSGVFETNVQGVVLETYGTGNVSARKRDFIEVVHNGIKKGIIVVIASQCNAGTVNLGAYETGKQLEKIGCLSARDMTTEATVTKLSYLLGLNIKHDEVCRLMETDLRGEFSPRRPTMRRGSNVNI